MKLLSGAVMGLLAAEYAYGVVTPKNIRETEVYVPFDCVNESDTKGGWSSNAAKKSDRDYIPSMPTNGYISKITGCWDLDTNLVTGIQAIWNDGTGDVQASRVGKMSGTFEWPNKAGKSGDSLEALEKYYFRVATPDYVDWVTQVNKGTN